MSCLLAVVLPALASQHVWCVAPHNSPVVSGDFRGDFRDFSLYVAPHGSRGCSEVIAPFTGGNDGLWVLEFDNVARYNEAKQKTRKAGIRRVYDEQQQLVMIVQGGEDVPDKTDLDACGGEIGVSVIPVAAHRVTYPKGAGLSDVPLGVNPAIRKVVNTVSREKLEDTVKFLSSYHTRNSYSAEARNAEEWLRKTYRSFNFTVSTFEFRADMPPVVCAEWRGAKHPTDYVVVGAHYDSRSTDNTSPTQKAPGADDNATGTSALVELARLVSQLGLRLSYGLRLCSFSGEEQGLLGSRALAAAWSEAGVSVKVMFNADMLGWQIPGQNITLGFKDKSISVNDTEHVRSIVAQYLPDLPTAYSSSCCSDYMSFFENGWPSVGFFENAVAASSYPHYHTSDDTAQYVNFEQLQLEVKAIVASVLTYAGVL